MALIEVLLFAWGRDDTIDSMDKQHSGSSIIRIPFDENTRQMPSSKVLGSTITSGVYCLEHDVNIILVSKE